MDHPHTVGKTQCRRFDTAQHPGRGPRHRFRLGRPAPIEVLHENPDGRSTRGEARTQHGHRARQQRRRHAHDDVGLAPPGRQKLQAKCQFHCCTSDPRCPLRHEVIEAANSYKINLLLRAEPRRLPVPPPLRVVRITRENLHVMAPVRQADRNAGGIGRDARRFRRVVNSL